jgi:uncharacterized membrane protein
MNKSRPISNYSFFYIFQLSLLLVVLVMIQDPPLVIQALRVVVGAPFVLFLPGYCLMTAAFPARADLEGKARLALSFGLSLVLLPTLALILDALPWGITLWSVMVGNLVVIGLLMVVTCLRQRTLPPEERFEPLDQLRPGQAWRVLELQYRAAYIIVVLLVIAFSMLAYTIIALPSPADRMTEFYILGDAGMAEGYPHQLTANQPYDITVGVRNMEKRDHIYHIIASDGSGRIGVAEPFRLQQQELTEFTLTFTPVETGPDVKITFDLFINGRTQPYRSLHLYTRVVQSN